VCIRRILWWRTGLVYAGCRLNIKTRLQRWTGSLRDQLAVLRCAARHPDTPKFARWLVVAALAYAMSPIDLIPDFIPVLGWLDDLLLVPILLWLAIRAIPPSVWKESREEVLGCENRASGHSGMSS